MSVKHFAVLCLVLCSSGWVRGQTEDQPAEREFGFTPLIGLHKPDHIRPISTQTPVGFELRYSRLHTDPTSWMQCHCFYRSGVFLNAYSFRNPVALGQSAGAGLFFEPVLVQNTRWGLSLRALAGLAYVSRQYDPVRNPGSSAFGTAVNGLIGVSFITRYNIAPAWRLLVGLDYKHISNAGVRLPNQGLNIPALSVGVMRYTGSTTLPNLPQRPVSTFHKRWMARTLAFGSVKVMEATSTAPQRSYPIYGVNLLVGYHLTQTHVLSGGLEWLDDHYFREQVRRWTGRRKPTYQQGTLLAGYEFWQGHFMFTAHWGWNLIRPRTYQPDTYQKYSLLYRFTNGLTSGVAVKAYGEDTKNFQLQVGITF